MTDKPRKLLNIDQKPERYEGEARERYDSRRQGPVRAAYIQAAAMQDSFRGSDLQFEGNLADALYHIATALNRIAEAMERKP